MAELDVRTLSVTLRSASGTIGYSNEIYDENYVDSTGKTGASQSDINQELKSAIGKVEHPINGVATDDKILKVGTSDKLLSSTLNLKYEKRSGDDAKKIYLTGINDAVIASIDASDFIKDKFVSKVVLYKDTPESGITDPAVPYIKIIFNDESVIRFGVKDLIKLYDGSNLELSSQYADTKAATPESGKSLDAVIKNLDLRVGTNTSNIETITKTTIPALSTRVDNAEIKLGSVLNKVSASSTSTISDYITLSASTRDYSNHEQSITLSTPSDTPIITVGSDITNVKNGTGGSGAVTNQIVTALAVNQYVNTNFATVDRVGTLEGKVSNNATALTKTIDIIYGASDTNGFISIGTDYVEATKSTTLTPDVKVATTGTEIGAAITEKNDKLASAIGAGEYTQTYVNSVINPITEKITDLESSRLKQVNGSTGTYVTISATNPSANKQTISATLTTKTLSAATSSSNGLALAYDIKENCTIASVVGSSTYDEWDKIVS